MSSVRVLSNFVGGEHRRASGSETIDVVSPVTGETVATSPISSAADVADAYAVAAKAFEEWRETTPSERQHALLQIADAVEARADEFVKLEAENTGKPWGLTASEELPPMVDQIRFFAGAARVLEGRGSAEYMKGHTSWIRREPVGVCGQVTPWNYPLLMATWKFAPAIAAGNTVVLKPSDTTPETTLLLAEVASEFLPAGVFNVITGDRTTGEAMVADPTPAMVSITGSVRAGMEVARGAASGVKRVHLELGGKAPVIVFADADLDAAVEGAIAAKMRNIGEACTAANRFLVEESVAQEFGSKLAARLGALVVGDGTADGTQVGPLVEGKARDNVDRLVQDATARGGRALAGGRPVDGPGYFYEPTVLLGMGTDAGVFREEIFGPVAPIFTFRDEDEAVAMANDTEYGLASYVYTSDLKRAHRIGDRLEFGLLGLNAGVISNAAAPFGGVKQSGLGREGGAEGIAEYTTIQYMGMANPWA